MRIASIRRLTTRVSRPLQARPLWWRMAADQKTKCTSQSSTLLVGGSAAGSVLEIFPFVSKCAAAKYEDGSTIYYPEVLNRQSKYVWWIDHPTEADLGTLNPPNWGASAFTTDFDTTSEKVLVTSAVGTFTVGETVADAAGAVVDSGYGAVLGHPTVGNGGILTIPTFPKVDLDTQ